MTTQNSIQQTRDTASKVASYLGIPTENIGNKNHASLYIIYSHNGTTYELRISDHMANPSRVEAKKMIFGYTTLELGNDWEIAKREIDRKIFDRWEKIVPGTIINHPSFGEGRAIEHDVEKDMLVVDFLGTKKSLFATAVIDRGWVVI